MRSASNLSNIEINLQEHLNTLTPEIALEDLEPINSVISTYTTSFSTSAANATNLSTLYIYPLLLKMVNYMLNYTLTKSF